MSTPLSAHTPVMSLIHVVLTVVSVLLQGKRWCWTRQLQIRSKGPHHPLRALRSKKEEQAAVRA